MTHFKRAAWLASANVLALASLVNAEDARPPQPNIVVTAPRQEEKARQKQKDAPVLVNIQSAETIQKSRIIMQLKRLVAYQGYPCHRTQGKAASLTSAV